MATPQLYKATGIILKRKNIGEGDKIITVFCQHLGKKRLIGKGVRKVNSRRAGHLELFSKTAFLIHNGKTLDYITGADVQRLYGSHYTDLQQIACAYCASEMIDRLIMEGQEHDEAYTLFDRFLADIGTVQFQELPNRLRLFIDDLLMNLGYKRKESMSTSLENSIFSVERIIQRKVRSANLLSKSGLFDKTA